MHRFRNTVVRECSAYPFTADMRGRHAPDGGLLTLARLPIETVRFTPYRDRGNWYGLSLMDRMLRKGVLETHMRMGGQSLVVLNTHLNANYSGDWGPGNPFAKVERGQLRQLAEIVATLPADMLVLVAGDFNVPRESDLMYEFLANSGLTDPMAGDTRPTYRIFRGLPGRYAIPIDYTLVRAPALPGLQIAADLRFQDQVRLPDSEQSFLSDHLGILLSIRWNAP